MNRELSDERQKNAGDGIARNDWKRWYVMEMEAFPGRFFDQEDRIETCVDIRRENDRHQRNGLNVI